MHYQDAIKEFFDVLQVKNIESATRIALLEKALDALAFSRHFVPNTQAKTNDEPPKWDYKERYKLVGSCFPDLGYYVSSHEPLAVENPDKWTTGLGDAIDDLADIAGDLHEVRWYLENGHPEDAAWTFNFLYRTHWGEHLRELQLYLRNLASAD